MSNHTIWSEGTDRSWKGDGMVRTLVTSREGALLVNLAQLAPIHHLPCGVCYAPLGSGKARGADRG